MEVEGLRLATSPLFRHEAVWMFFATPRALHFLLSNSLAGQFGRFFSLVLTHFPEPEAITVCWAEDPEMSDKPWVTLCFRVREDSTRPVHDCYNDLVFALVDEKLPARDEGLIRVSIDISGA